jgi:hypothetical protein
MASCAGAVLASITPVIAEVAPGRWRRRAKAAQQPSQKRTLRRETQHGPNHQPQTVLPGPWPAFAADAGAAATVAQEADDSLPTQGASTVTAKSSASPVMMIRRVFVMAMSMPFVEASRLAGRLINGEVRKAGYRSRIRPASARSAQRGNTGRTR